MQLRNTLKFWLLVLLTTMVICRTSVIQGFSQTKDFEVKGFHIDLRIQVMKLNALKDFALKLSKSGVNTIIMEYEATFPFEKHPLIPNRYAYTKNEIKEFVAYCTTLKIDVIPLQQTFGHVEYILRYQQYKNLREDQQDYSQVNPLEVELDRQLFTDLIKEMVALHPSKYVHIGADETRLLGYSKASKEKVKKEGVGKLYGDYVAMICDIVLKMGKTPLLWADIALKHPEALKLIPIGVVFVDWNYGWGMDKFGDHSKLMESGFEVWGAPSLRSSPDNYNLTTWEKHFDNITDFVPKARELGYNGMVMTSWSTSGVYSYVRESAGDLVDLVAVRRVYPLTGFNILLEAYLKGINMREPLDVSKFIEGYALKNYGLKSSEAIQFKQALFTAPFEMRQGEVSRSKMTVNELRDSVKWASETFERLKPTQNKTEFEHYRLMTNIRLQYLNYQVVEAAANRKNVDDAKIQVLTKQLEQIIAETEKLNKQYINLNKSVFYVSELEIDNQLRLAKPVILYDKLMRVR